MLSPAVGQVNCDNVLSPCPRHTKEIDYPYFGSLHACLVQCGDCQRLINVQFVACGTYVVCECRGVCSCVNCLHHQCWHQYINILILIQLKIHSAAILSRLGNYDVVLSNLYYGVLI